MKYICILLLFQVHFSYSQVYLKNMLEKKNYNKLAGEPLSEKYGQVRALKVVFDLQSKDIFFINAKYYDYHYQFCESVLQYPYSLSIFNERNYSETNKRKYLLASINYYPVLDILA